MKTPSHRKMWKFLLRSAWHWLMIRLGVWDFYKAYAKELEFQVEYEAYICQFPEFLKEYCNE